MCVVVRLCVWYTKIQSSDSLSVLSHDAESLYSTDSENAYWFWMTLNEFCGSVSSVLPEHYSSTLWAYCRLVTSKFLQAFFSWGLQHWNVPSLKPRAEYDNSQSNVYRPDTLFPPFFSHHPLSLHPRCFGFAETDWLLMYKMKWLYQAEFHELAFISHKDTDHSIWLF